MATTDKYCSSNLNIANLDKLQLLILTFLERFLRRLKF